MKEGKRRRRERRTYSSAGLTLMAISTNSPFRSKMKCDRHELEISAAEAQFDFSSVFCQRGEEGVQGIVK
jgi:hypothetical protein